MKLKNDNIKDSSKVEKKSVKLEGYENNLGYQDDEIITITDEFAQIQRHIGMYISYRGVKGALHLFKEIFNNSLDECVSDRSPGDAIEIYHNPNTNQIICKDNGRGIPFDKMVEVCTKKHSGSKDGREFNKYSAGENGVGIKVTVALSKYFSMTCYRGGYFKQIEFFNSEIVEHEPVKVEDKKAMKHGTITVFQPSEEYLGECHIESEDIVRWLTEMQYIIPKSITILYTLVTLEPLRQDDDREIFRDFEYKPMSEAVNKMVKTKMFEPISLTAENDHMEIQAVFTYDMASDDTMVDSFCNYVHTIDGGTHVDVSARTIYEFFVNKAREIDPNAKNEVIIDDCKKGLTLFVNCRHADPQFGGQTKEKIDNKSIFTEAKPLLKECINQYFVNNNALLRKIINYLRQMAKIRKTSSASKSSYVKKAKSWLDDAELKCYYPTTNRNSRDYCELILCEGDSAAGNIAKARNPRFQAILGLRGVIKNTVDCSLEEALKSDILKTLTTVLDCGTGKNFNINDLKWDKIIIMTDADCDGSFIMSLICIFFSLYFPEIIKEGRLYRCIPPLYDLDVSTIKSKKCKKRYLFDKKEKIEIRNQIIADNLEWMTLHNIDPIKCLIVESEDLNRKEILEFLTRNQEYYTELNRLKTDTFSKTELIEYVCRFYLLYGGVNEKFAKAFTNVFKEMHVDIENQSVYGSINKSREALIIDDIFLNKAAYFMEILKSNEPYFYVKYRNKNSSNADTVYTIFTIGEFLSKVISTYDPVTNKRYKGLGEMQTEVLFESSLNPSIRRLIRLTVKDIQELLDTINLLHGSGRSEDRKDLIRNMRFTRDDIDN